VFERWREIDQPDSLWRVRLLTHQMETRRITDFANYLQKIGAVPTCRTVEQREALHARIKQYRSRDRKNALEKRHKPR
jgi:hypothetical protein